MPRKDPKYISCSQEQWELVNKLADRLAEERGPRPSLNNAIEEAVLAMLKGLDNEK